MDKKQAAECVQQTFTKSFNKDQFYRFTKELLNNINDTKAGTWGHTYIKDAFKPHVQVFLRLGTYSTQNGERLDLLVVNLTKESKLERARTALRNFVADHLKQRDNKDAALVAFVSPTEKTWRFSYIKMEYATVEKGMGEFGTEARLTPARRFSYLVGEGESCHTAQTRFLKLLQDTSKNPTLKDIEEAFSVEAVTKEFFANYVKLFERITEGLETICKKDKVVREEFATQGLDPVDFAKKLMGQIVFLYFVQKKGWLGVAKDQNWGDGPHNFLRRLANKEYSQYKNFFNDALEPLFYNTLATDRGHDAWCKEFNCRVPFLNGGLFEPVADYDWQKTDITLPNELFTNNERVDEGVFGTGILDVFDRYNFTVNEAEPLEKEVAIDPEMLGKVFENLIEDNRRKGLGAYYTPREIVHYMCQESLINYIDTAVNKGEPRVPRAEIETFIHLGEQIAHYESVATRYTGINMPKKIEEHARLIDDKLSTITVCDPAIGSGAFPVGMMSEIVRARLALTSCFNDARERSAYYFKRNAIQNCLYGVDIDPGAIEIAKLRLWLSLVVDEEDVKHIKPLPNLDYKIMQGNSLLEEYEGIKLFDEKIVEAGNYNETLRAGLKTKQADLQREYIELDTKHRLTPAKKIELNEGLKKIDAQLKKILKQNKDNEKPEGLFDFYSEAKKKADLLKKLHKDIFNTTQKKSKDQIKQQIDCLEWELIEATLKEQGKSDELGKLSALKKAKTKPFFLWKLHFAEVFQAGGFDVVIANPPYIFARNSAEKGMTTENKSYFYRNYALAEYQVNLYPLFIEKADRLLRALGSLTFITPNNWMTINTNKALRNFVLGRSNIVIVNFYARVFETADVDSAILIYEKGQHNPHIRLLEYTDTFHELKSAPPSFFTSQRESIINIEMFKGDQDQYSLLSKIEVATFPLSHFADVKVGLGAYGIGKGNPPQTKDMIEKRVFHSKTKEGKDYFPYLDGKNVCRYYLGWSGEFLKHGDHLREPRRNWALFSSKRILVRQIPCKPPYCIHACYTNETILNDRNSMNVINIKADPLAILAILNSRLISFWFALKFGKLQRGLFPQFKANELADFPISKNLSRSEKRLAELAHKATQKRRADASVDIGQIDREIDTLVYDLYGLTKEEIEIVEGVSK
ncbi:MAG: N-6 DNA methylase [Deltaproteobacteria bacterium]|nr:N-6 DNA methylase [Deltaproteobacteria bacterium]